MLTAAAAHSDDELLATAEAFLAQGQERLRRGDFRGAIENCERCREQGERMCRTQSWRSGWRRRYFCTSASPTPTFGQYEKSVEYQKRSLAMDEEIGYKQGVASNLT
jgi:hypothetical protein